MITKRCKGCGSILQNKILEGAGYTPNLDENTQYCRRCFRMKHYNELPKIVATNEDYEKVIDVVVRKKALMVFIIDIFSFKTTFHPQMVDKLRNSDVILVANKVDLLPKSVNRERVVEWIAKQCQRYFFKVLAVGIVSAKKGHYIEDLMHMIDAARVERDVYFVGCANVGKSSIINALLKQNTSATEDIIATSMVPGTTLNEIRIPFFEDNRAFIDTPGLINPVDVLNHLMPTSYPQIVPNKELKPITYQLENDSALFLGGLASIEIKTQKRISLTVYASSNLYLHRCKSSRVEELYENQLGKLLVPPKEDELENLKYDSFDFRINNEKKALWFSGFGFIQLTGPCDLHVKTIAETEVYLTDAIVG